MKGVKRITLVIILIVLSIRIGSAQDLTEILENDNGRYRTHLVESKFAKYKLVYPVKRKEIVRVSIYDSRERLVYSEKLINKNGFVRSYDFENLPNGRYRFEIWSNKGTVRREIIHKYQHQDIDISVNKTEDPNSYKLIVKGVTRKPVYVDIYDKKDRLVYEDVVTVGKDFSRIYSLEGLENDQIEFKITYDRSSVMKSFEKE